MLIAKPYSFHAWIMGTILKTIKQGLRIRPWVWLQKLTKAISYRSFSEAYKIGKQKRSLGRFPTLMKTNTDESSVSLQTHVCYVFLASTCIAVLCSYNVWKLSLLEHAFLFIKHELNSGMNNHFIHVGEFGWCWSGKIHSQLLTISAITLRNAKDDQELYF